MDKLKGKTIFIGKEPGQGRLLIALRNNGEIKTGTIGRANCVPNCVSRCKPSENIAHCKIEIGTNGEMTITNIKEENVTYINNVEVLSKRISLTDTIALGKDRYAVNVKAVLEVANNILEPTEYSITPLKAVWEQYHNSCMKLKKMQRKNATIKSLYLPLIVLSGGVSAAIRFLGLDEDISNPISYFAGGLAFFFLFYGLYLTITDRSIEKQERINDKFQAKYICPNPKCNHFLGQQPYNILRQNKNCPYCKVKWVEDNPK